MQGLKTFIGLGLTVTIAAACGATSSERVTIEATPAAMRKAAEITLDKRSAKIDLSMQMTIAGKDVTLHGTGVLDQPDKKSQMDLDIAPIGQHISQIQDGTVIYTRSPAFEKLAAGKEWIKFDLGKANSAFSDLMGSSGGGPLGSDPSSFLQSLEGAGKVSQVGAEDVRGARTTHFSGNYTLSDALNAQPADRRQKLQAAFAALGLPESAAVRPIDFDAWIDGDGLVRRISTTIDRSQFSTNSNGPTGKVSMTLELYDFGTSVDIHPPADDDVQDVSGLIPKPSTSSTAN